jgi:hypothetical protein
MITTYFLQPGNHRIPSEVQPLATAPGDDLFESFFASMRPAFLSLLANAPGADGHDHDLIVDAYRAFMLEIAPRSQTIRYKTFRAGRWSFNIWLLDRLKYFVADRAKLSKALAAAERAARNAQADDTPRAEVIELSGGGEFCPDEAEVVVYPKFGGGDTRKRDFRVHPQPQSNKYDHDGNLIAIGL